MTDDEIVHLLRAFYEGLFPKVCSNCGHRFGTLKDYILATKRLWPSQNYDIEMGNYAPVHPIGGLAMANCVCGTTLALSSENMPPAQNNLILEWIRTETIRRALRPEEILDRLRDEVRELVLGEAIQEPPQEDPRIHMPNQSTYPMPASGTPCAEHEPRPRGSRYPQRSAQDL